MGTAKTPEANGVCDVTSVHWTPFFERVGLSGRVSFVPETSSVTSSSSGPPIWSVVSVLGSSTMVPTAGTVSARTCGHITDRGRPGGGGDTSVEGTDVKHVWDTVWDPSPAGTLVRSAAWLCLSRLSDCELANLLVDFDAHLEEVER